MGTKHLPQQRDLFADFDRGERTGPPAQKTRTSIAAAEAIAAMAPTLRGQVYGFLTRRGAQGATYEEISLGLAMRLQTVCARVNELRDQGLVRPNGQKRKTTSGRDAMVVVAVGGSAVASDGRPVVDQEGTAGGPRDRRE